MTSIKKRYIARIKIYKKPIFSLICSRERDYIVYPPKSSKVLNNGGYFNFHFTLHTINNRVTQKVTDFGNIEEDFENILNRVDDNDFYVSRDKNGKKKDIDITKGEYYLDLDNTKFIGNIFNFGINDVHNKKNKITDFFCESKRSDGDFKNVVDISFDKKLKDVEIHLNVCKNFILKNPIIAYQHMGVKYEEAYMFDDFLGSDHYIFIILIKKQIANEKK